MSPEPVSDQPAERRRALSRRKLRLAGVVMVVIAAIVVVMGITTRRMADARLNEWTERVAIPTVAVAVPDDRGRRSTDRPAGAAGGLFAGAALRARQRLPEGMEGRHRHAGEGRAAARRDRGARPRPADHAGRSRPARARRPTSRLPRQTLQRGQIADQVRRGVEAGRSTSASPTRQSRQGLLKSAQANLDRAAACWRNTSASSRRSTASSRRAPPTSAR